MAIASQKQVGRTANGQFRPGVSGNGSGNVHRSRHALNSDTIREMHAAFRRGGREAIDKVMRTQPAAFLKLLVLLVPREMKVEHTGGVKAMTDEQLEQGIEAIQEMLAQREAGDGAKVIDAVPEPVALPAPSCKPRRKRGSEAKASPLIYRRSRRYLSLRRLPSRTSRNSFGPFRSRRLRRCRSSSGADGSIRRSISSAAISDAFAAFLVRTPVREHWGHAASRGSIYIPRKRCPPHRGRASPSPSSCREL